MAIMDSLKKFVFPAVEEEEIIEEAVKAPKAPVREDAPAPGVRKSKVVNLPASADKKIVVVKLDSNAGVKTILDHLKQKTPVIFNIARLDRGEAGRAVDVVYGASYALDGSMQKVSNDIFVVTPAGMEIAGDISELMGATEDFSLDI